MTSAELIAWRNRHFGRRGTPRAAEALALSLDGLRAQLTGKRPVSRQTERIVELYDRLAAPEPKA